VVVPPQGEPELPCPLHPVLLPSPPGVANALIANVAHASARSVFFIVASLQEIGFRPKRVANKIAANEWTIQQQF
jgi:hypothetical protein